MSEEIEKAAPALVRRRRRPAPARAAKPQSIDAKTVAEIAQAAVAAYIAAQGAKSAEDETPEQVQARAKAAIARIEGDIDNAVRAAPTLPEGHVKIILSDSKHITRGGQFFGVNGASYMLKPGVPAVVPQGILDNLNNSVEGVPIQDPDTLQIIEYRDALRFPYRVIS